MTFKCKVCGRKAEIWYEYGHEFADHLDYVPEDGHEPEYPDDEEAGF